MTKNHKKVRHYEPPTGKPVGGGGVRISLTLHL